jgi:hypothetical protein
MAMVIGAGALQEALEEIRQIKAEREEKRTERMEDGVFKIIQEFRKGDSRNARMPWEDIAEWGMQKGYWLCRGKQLSILYKRECQMRGEAE